MITILRVQLVNPLLERTLTNVVIKLKKYRPCWVDFTVKIDFMLSCYFSGVKEVISQLRH